MKINVQWIVKNKGLGVTKISSWVDRVYWTKNFTVDRRQNFLTAIRHTGQLYPLGEYKVNRKVSVPKYIFGTYFIFIQVDAGNSVFEHVADQNNILVSVCAVIFDCCK